MPDGSCVNVADSLECEAIWAGVFQGVGTDCHSGIICPCSCLATGDIDGDGNPLTISDYSWLFGFVEGSADPFDSLCLGDLNGDCVVDQGDVELFECFFVFGLSCFTPYGGYPVTTCCDPDTVVGACCESDTCFVRSQANCDSVGGNYLGDGTLCIGDPCGPTDTIIIIEWNVIAFPKGPVVIDTASDTVGGSGLRMTISNMGSGGDNGLALDLGDSNYSWDGQWMELEPDTGSLPEGAFIEITAIEKIGGLPDQTIGSGRAEKIGTEWEISADFSPIGATRQTVLVLDSGMVVGISQNHTGPAAMVPKPPDDWHWTVAPSGARIQHGCISTWDTLVEIHLLGNKGVMHVSGDAVQMIPEDDTLEYDFLSVIEIKAASIPTITFTDMSTSVCCVGIRGNVDGDGGDQVNVADLTYLVDYLFRSGPAPPCAEEGDVNGDGNLNVADLTYLVDYLFRGGAAPPPCP